MTALTASEVEDVLSRLAHGDSLRSICRDTGHGRAMIRRIRDGYRPSPREEEKYPEPIHFDEHPGCRKPITYSRCPSCRAMVQDGCDCLVCKRRLEAKDSFTCYMRELAGSWSQAPLTGVSSNGRK